jgi:BirA family biotin operon repressor/biotin-[acetyl-CoA-carboxylase] ligase
MGSLAATQAMRRFGVAAQIKWPNDVVVVEGDDGRPSMRKLGGVLVEGVRPADASTSFLLGIGLNVNQDRQHLPEDAPIAPTSMLLEKGERLDRVAVCRAVLRELNEWYRRVRMGQLERVLARWRRLSCLLHRPIQARVDGQTVEGTVLGIRSTGELILEIEPGSTMLLSEEKTELLPW